MKKPLFGVKKSLLQLLVAVGSVSLLSGCVVHIGQHQQSEEFKRQLSLSTANLSRLSVESGAGDVKIIGVAGKDEISVDANIRAESSESRDYVFSLERSGNEAILVGKARRGRSFGFSTAIRVNMTIKVPMNFDIEVEDGSGHIELSHIDGDVNINDSSGYIEVKHLGANLTVEDGSGRVNISDVKGNVDVDDGSGALFISHVGGEVEIEDGSGGIDVSDVTNIVKIDDGSGSISVSRVQRLEIIESGSGQLFVEDVDTYID
jgi:hypothetical protein